MNPELLKTLQSITLLTERELKNITSRYEVRKLLEEGNTFAQVEKETGASPVTITRVNKWIKTGKY